MKIYGCPRVFWIIASQGVEELTHWKRLWCWEGLGAGGEGDDRGWDGWMASPTQWMWVWVNSRSWWWTGRPGMLRFMGSQSRTWLSDWTELNWLKVLMEIIHPHKNSSIFFGFVKKERNYIIGYTEKLTCNFLLWEIGEFIWVNIVTE